MTRPDHTPRTPRASGRGPDTPPTARAAAWLQHKERSSLLMLRIMSWLSLRLGRRVSRLVLYGIAAYFVCFAPAARRASRDYLARVLPHKPTPLDGFKQVLAFASTIHDRVYLINDRFELFRFRAEGEAPMRAVLAKKRGAFLIGAHLGSFEALSAVGRRMTGQRAAMLMFEENARKINQTLAAINPRATADIIGMGSVDSMLNVRQRLDEGGMVGMLADRTPGDEATLLLPFLGGHAAFPIGPFRLAALMARPVVFMAGIYEGGNRYCSHFELIADFSDLGDASAAQRTAAIHAAIARYAAILEKHCRAAPYNWFNFFDFWSPAATLAQVHRAAAPPQGKA
jgi:predicted LPLAT superfamily acyltransferase